MFVVTNQQINKLKPYKQMKEIQSILNRIAEKINLATTKEKAIELKQDKYVKIEFNSAYGGYRVINVDTKNGAHYGFFGGNGCENRLSKKLMMLKLSSILIGITETEKIS